MEISIVAFLGGIDENIGIGVLSLVCFLLIIDIVLRVRARAAKDKGSEQSVASECTMDLVNKLHQETQTILTALPIGIAIYDKNARQEYVNDAVMTMFGVIDVDAHRARHILLYDDPVLNDDIKNDIRKGINVDVIIDYDLNRPLETDYFETDLSNMMYIDGKVRYVKNDRGEVEKYILIIRDITQKHTDDLLLQRTELNLEMALDAGEVEVWHYDVKKQCFYSIYGKMLTFDGATIDDVSSVMHPDYKETFRSTFDKLLSGEVKTASYVDVMMDGVDHCQYYSTKVLAVYSDTGELVSLIGTHKNITDEYYYQQELEQSVFKMELAIKTSHITQWNYDCSSEIFNVLNDTIADDNTLLVAADYLKLMHPDDIDMACEQINLMNERRDSGFSIDVRMRLPESDNWQYVTIDGAPIKNSKGEIVKYTGFRKNNTKFVELNERLRQMNIQLNLVLKAGNIIPAVVDVETDLAYVSHVDEDLLKNNRLGVPLDTLLQNMHADDKLQLKQLYNDLATGTKLNAHCECRYDKSGVFNDIFDTYFMGIDYNKQGVPRKIVGYTQNITERKNAEIQLVKQKELMTSILDRIPVPIHIKDIENEYKYVYWNAESRKLFGDGLDRSVKDILGERRGTEIEKIDKIVFETGKPYTCEERVRKLDGLVYDTIVHKSVILDGDKKLLLVVRWDVSMKNELVRKDRIISMSMNTLNAFTWSCDLRDGVYHYTNELSKFGVDPNELNTVPKFAKRIHVNYREDFISRLEDFYGQDSGEFSMQYEFDLNDNGEYEWWESRGVIDTFKDDSGVIYKYIYGLNVKIDKLKKNELAILKNKMELDELNKQTELILNNSNTGLVFLDNNYLVQWSNLPDYIPGHPLTKNYKKGNVCYKMVMGREKPCVNCIVARSIASGKIESKEFVADDITCELTSSPIYDNDHQRIGSVLKVTDVTENVRVNRELLVAKNKAETANVLLSNIIDRLPCLLFIKDIDDDYRHIIANKYFCNVVGKSIDQIIGKTDFELFGTGGDAVKFHNDDMMAVQNRLLIYEEETTFLGNRIVWKTTKASVHTADGHHLLIALCLDITDKIKAFNELHEAKEKAEQSNRLKSAFLANMSHEIRTPLNAIVGFSELMISAESDHEKQEYSNIINTNNDLLLRLIGDILDLSKIEAGMIELKHVEFDVADLFPELALMLKKKITNKDINLVCLNPYSKFIIELDKNRFVQVVTNFVTNAIKFTAKGEITMSYEYVDGGIKVKISDTGIGIAKDKLGKVFERFEKLDDFAQGTGLGMAICKAILDSCGGKIGVESEEGVGSTFWAWTPLDPQPKITFRE